jgi:hypothetical protein
MNGIRLLSSCRFFCWSLNGDPFLSGFKFYYYYYCICCYLYAGYKGWRKKNACFWNGVPACDFFLWSYLKSKVYVRKPRTVDDLKVSIPEEIATVPQAMLVNVMQNFEERLRTCVRQEGRYLSNIIFRKWVINWGNQNCVYYKLFWC